MFGEKFQQTMVENKMYEPLTMGKKTKEALTLEDRNIREWRRLRTLFNRKGWKIEKQPFLKLCKYMKTKASKIIFSLSGLTLAIVTSLMFFSCQKEEIVSTNESFDYEQIGVEHNKGLAYIFEYLKDKGVGKKSNLKGATDIFELTKKATLSFAQTSKITKDSDYDKLPLTFKSFNYSTLKSAGMNELVSSISSEIELSQLQISYFNQLDQIMSNLEIGLESTIEKIKKIESDIISECATEEAEILLSSTSVARHSLEYWSKNYEKWLIELGGVDVLTLNTSRLKSSNIESDWDWFCDTLKNMGKSDVVGGAIGAGVGALAGGVGAAPGAVAGACYSSAGRGIVALLDHWGVW